MKKLLVIETDGMNDIVQVCNDAGWDTVFLKTQSYHSWLPLERNHEKTDIRSYPDLSFFDIIKLIDKEGINSILPISLLEPEGVRDSLIKDYLRSHHLPVNIVANSPSTMESTYDKWLTKDILSSFEIAVTPGRLIHSADCAEEIMKVFDFPLIIKERKGYMGMGVRMIDNALDLKKYIKRNLQKGLFAEPFIAGSEVSMEVITWKDKMVFQPLVYKGETRINMLEHPAYRPRISPYKRGTAVEKKIIAMVTEAVGRLQLEGAAEFEFIIVGDEPYIMEVNPRISGITRLCNAAGGINVYQELAHVCIHDTMNVHPPQAETKYAIQFPLTVFPAGELLESMQNNPHIGYIKPIDWMPVLPIKSNVIMSYDTQDELFKGVIELQEYTHARYIEEAGKSFNYF